MIRIPFNIPTNRTMRFRCCSLLILLVFFLVIAPRVTSFDVGRTPVSRVEFLGRVGKQSLSVIVPVLIRPHSVIAAPERTVVIANDEIQNLKDGSEVLGSLLQNWQRATIDCTYADVPRDLLETKNKELLIEKAKTSALFDKSASVVSCRKNARIVRDYIGATGKGPLVGAEKRFLKRLVADRVDPDLLDDYYAEVENFSKALAKASSLSYIAGMSDLDSINTFSKGEESSSDDSAFLEQSKKAIFEAKESMDKAIKILILSDF